jgi:hypothetical protein
MPRLKVVHRTWEWIKRLPPLAVAVLAAVVLAGFSAAGVVMYRTYAFVEHDNEFCMSCHLMQDPFERFARSEHAGLGCKACHQPTMMARTQMALAQIFERPEEITHHAEVPNAMCAGCHVDGDPERWRQIQSTVGHRVHLESDDPSLSGLMCVECHSTSIHEFATTRQTCAQSGCHDDLEIRLGKMGGMTIHCVGCHDFSRPVTDVAAGDIGVKPLEPRRDECASCHAMRVLMEDFPADDPHDAACGACHNPHDQETPRQAERTCATAGCHDQPEQETPMHRGLGVGVLQECLTCHEAHDFRTRGDDCLACHQDIYQEGPLPFQGGGAQTATLRLRERFASLWRGSSRGVPVQARAPAQETTRRSDRPLVFAHAEHRGVECLACHSTERTHGQVTVTSVRDCRQCHHTGEVARTCATCHDNREILPGVHPVRQTVRLSVSAPQERRLPFTHREHVGLGCTDCHRQPLTMGVDRACSTCHVDHHQRATTNCIACHAPPRDDAHTASAHLGCAGSGCHSPVPFQGVPRTRNLCLSCHQDLVRHEPQGNCIDCHPLPRPRAAADDRLPAERAALRGGRP